MVCVPCILIPLALFIWHRYLLPVVTKFLPEEWIKRLGLAQDPKAPAGHPKVATEGGDHFPDINHYRRFRKAIFRWDAHFLNS